MSKVHLFVSDLDGTLLDMDADLSANARNLIVNSLQEQKKLFTIASARSITTITEILGQLPFKLPIIQLNGALITDYHSWEDMHQVFINKPLSEKVAILLREIGACFLASVKESNHDINRCLIPQQRNQAMDAFYQERISKGDERIKIIKTGDFIRDYRLINITIIEQHERSKIFLDIIHQEFGQYLEIYPMGVDQYGWEWTTIQDSVANKGNAVEKICEMFNHSLDQVTVFGDNLNDLSMFQKSFKGVAVENAHPIIKENADEIIPHHDQTSVAMYLYTS